MRVMRFKRNFAYQGKVIFKRGETFTDAEAGMRLRKCLAPHAVELLKLFDELKKPEGKMESQKSLKAPPEDKAVKKPETKRKLQKTGRR